MRYGNPHRNEELFPDVSSVMQKEEWGEKNKSRELDNVVFKY